MIEFESVKYSTRRKNRSTRDALPRAGSEREYCIELSTKLLSSQGNPPVYIDLRALWIHGATWTPDPVLGPDPSRHRVLPLFLSEVLLVSFPTEGCDYVGVD